MKISVAIPSLNFCGGAEVMTLSLIRLLDSKGYNVTLITSDKTDWDRINNLFGYNIVPDKEVYGMNYDVTQNISLMKTLEMLRVFRNLIKDSKDMLINTYGNLDIFLNYGNIAYINGIPFSIIDRYRAPIYMNYIIQKIYNLSRLFNNKPRNILISNSIYTRNIIRDRLNLESLVIHPPPTIRLDDIEPSKKENIVITISRISSGKKLDRILHIANMLKGRNLRFIVIGRLYDHKYYSMLLKLKEELDLDNVIFLTNTTKHIILEYLASSKILLHTMDHEEYGLSIIEGMLARCIPIVPMNGGPWLDILNRKNGMYGYAYNNIEEASSIIGNLIDRYDLTKGELAMKRASMLADEFSKLFPKVLKAAKVV